MTTNLTVFVVLQFSRDNTTVTSLVRIARFVLPTLLVDDVGRSSVVGVNDGDGPDCFFTPLTYQSTWFSPALLTVISG